MASIPAPTYLPFSGMTAPNPADPTEIEWKLRYGHPTREELRLAASYIDAYKQLVGDSQRSRNAKITALRKAAKKACHD